MVTSPVRRFLWDGGRCATSLSVFVRAITVSSYFLSSCKIRLAALVVKLRHLKQGTAWGPNEEDGIQCAFLNGKEGHSLDSLGTLRP